MIIYESAQSPFLKLILKIIRFLLMCLQNASKQTKAQEVNKVQDKLMKNKTTMFSVFITDSLIKSQPRKF